MKVPLFDLKKQYDMMADEVRPVIEDVCASQNFILGPVVSDFEEKICKYLDAKYAVGVSSGSDALLIALMNEGIGAGDEVITTTFSFFATAGAISRVGAKPVFVDIEPDYFSIDVTRIEAAITEKTKAIIPVHLFGQCADMDPIMSLARRYGLIVIEDCAQAIGSQYKGVNVGTIGDYGCFSFFPTKNLGGYGDGGLVLCKEERKYEKLKSLRGHGAGAVRYHHTFVGGNFRLDALQAAVLGVKLNHLDSWVASRQTNRDSYCELLNGCPGIITPPTAPWCTKNVCNQFVVRILNGRRDEVSEKLSEHGVGSAVYYPLSLHLQDCFSDLNYHEGDFPVSEKITGECLALPIFPELSYIQREYVAQTLGNILRG